MNLQEILEEYEVYFSYIRSPNATYTVYEVNPLPTQINTFTLNGFESKIIEVLANDESQMIGRTYFISILGILDDGKYFCLHIRTICDFVNEFYTELYLSDNIKMLLTTNILRNNLNLLNISKNKQKL
jgi:hypothetical protein